MKRFFDAELENFRSHLLLMGERAIDQTRLAMRSMDLEMNISSSAREIVSGFSIMKLVSRR